MVYEYFITVQADVRLYGIGYKLNFKLDSIENLNAITEKLKEDGYKNPVVLFFKLLNEHCEE